MDQGFDVPIDSSGVSKLLALLKEIPTAARDADQALQGMSGSAKGIGGSRRQTISGLDPSDARFIDDPMARSSYMVSDLSRGRGSDSAGPLGTYSAPVGRSDKDILRDFDQAFKFDIAAGSAQYKLDQKMGREPKSRQDLIMDMIMTSRVLPGGKLSPLVGKLAKIGGMSGDIGAGLSELGLGAESAGMLSGLVSPITGAITAAIGTAVAMAQNAGAVHQLTGQYYRGGGTAQELGQALSLGGPNGGDKAAQFGEFLHGGGYGPAFFRSHGINDFGNFYSPNKSGNYVKALEMLRGVSEEDRMRIARGSPLESELWKTELSQDAWNSLKNSAGAASPGEKRTANEFQARADSIQNHLANTWRLAMAGTTAKANDIFSGDLRRTIKGLWNASAPGMFLNLGDYIGRAIAGNTSFDDGEGGSGGSSSMGPDRTGGRTNYVARSLKGGPDWSGGGIRAHGAVNPGVVAQSIDANYGFDRLKLGGFSV